MDYVDLELRVVTLFPEHFNRQPLTMNAHSGSPEQPAGLAIRNGKLQTWLQVPGQEPLLVVDQQNMGWSLYNNVTIDTLYFSVFFGGSSETFQAKKDEVSPLSFYYSMTFSATYLSRQRPERTMIPTSSGGADDLVRRHPSVGGPLRTGERALLTDRRQAHP